jgi:hypothetical protein
MALSILNNRREPNKIQDLIIDTSISEDHVYTNRVTDNTIEDGTTVSDHIVRDPEQLTINGIVSNTPITLVQQGENNLVREDLTNRVQVAHDLLLGYMGRSVPKQLGDIPEQQLTPQLLDIVTGLRTYTDMAITSLSFPRSRVTGNSLRFNISFRKVKKATAEFAFIPKTSTQKGEAPGINEQAAKTAETGKDQPKNVPDDSTLYSATQRIKGLLGI